MCPNAAIGETGTVKSVTYTKRTREQITTENAATTCTSEITDMSNLFRDKTTFNKNISSWDVSSVTNMYCMFGATSYNFNMSFNQDISSWDVSNVTNMGIMFATAKKFNQPIGNWDVSKVINMAGMFMYAWDFNQPIENWNVSNVIDMSYIFQSTRFDQPIGDWDVSNVVNMEGMFNGARSFNQPIGNWDVSKVINMSWMFTAATNFNQTINDWNVSNATNMDWMFGNTTFNKPIDKWCVQRIMTEPLNFSSSLLTENKPKWGTECTTLSNPEFTNLSSQLTISPNPFTSSVKINLSENTKVKQIQVINAVGQTVYASTETALNLEHLPAGMYFVKVNTNQGIATEKIIKN